MNKIKNIAPHLLELIAGFILLFAADRILDYLNDISSHNFSLIPVAVFNILYPFVFGLLIGLPRLMLRWNKYHGFNTTRFIILAVPGMIIILQYLIAVIVQTRMWFMFITHSKFYPFFAIWIGVVLVDCFKANSNIEKNNNTN